MKNSQDTDKNKASRAVTKQIKKTAAKRILDKHKNKKELNELATRYADTLLTLKGLERFGSCSDWLQFATTRGFDKAKLVRANFCMHRFCPMCNMRKAMKDAMALELVMESLKRDEYEFIFLTLTVPNCTGDELPKVLDQLNKDVSNLFKKKRLEDVVHGYIRKLEVTTDQAKKINKHLFKRKQEYFEKRGLTVGMNNPNFNTYHPHMHFILVVKKEYFKKHSSLYLTQVEWAELWREQTKQEQVIVDVRKLKESAESNAIKEIAKYSAKDSDLYHSEGVFATFFVSLRGRKLLTTSGIANERMKAFKNGELDYILEERHDERRKAQLAEKEMPVIFTDLLKGNWVEKSTTKRKAMDYLLRLEKMTDEEFKSINHPKDLELALEILDGDEKEFEKLFK